MLPKPPTEIHKRGASNVAHLAEEQPAQFHIHKPLVRAVNNAVGHLGGLNDIRTNALCCRSVNPTDGQPS
jgi:hypothetical protein